MFGSSANCVYCTSKSKNIFCELKGDFLKQINDAKTHNFYKKKQMLFYQGNCPYGIHCIRSGKIKLYRTDDQGHEKIIRIVGSGDVLGFRCILAEQCYQAYAEVLEDAYVCFIDRVTFLKTLQVDPKTALQMIQRLAEGMGAAEKESFELISKSVRQRLASVLLSFSVRYGEKKESSVLLAIELKREDLAHLVGTSPETVIRILKDFQKKKLIRVEKRKITLLNFMGLGALAGRAPLEKKCACFERKSF